LAGKTGRQLLFDKVKKMVGLNFAPIVATQCENNPKYFDTPQPVRVSFTKSQLYLSRERFDALRQATSNSQFHS
jgi:hypothetical protein